MILLKEESVKQADISKYKDMNVGYHAGDLGKSEFLGNQRGSNRGTGHFGTGTYFVGNIKNINIMSYKERPLHVVDFTSYNLYRPSSYSAVDLHNALKYINTYHEGTKNPQISKRDIEQVTWSEPDEQLELLQKYIWITGQEDAKEYFRIETDHEYQEYLDGTFSGSVPNRFFDRFERDLSDVMEWQDRTKQKQWQAAFELAHIFNISEKKVLQICDEVYDEISINPDRHSDSASTRFMKRMGYEGIDVRHIPKLDNTEFGSVIYDIKPETVLE